jgi:hypothetical protein
MGLVGDPTAWVVANGPGIQPGSQGGGEISSGAVIPRDDDRRSVADAVEQRGEQKRPQRLRHKSTTAGARERVGLRVVFCVNEEGAEHSYPVTVWAALLA